MVVDTLTRIRNRTFRESLASGAMLFDGATGTEIYNRGVLFNRSFDELNVSQPDLILGIHTDYVHAGAQIVETNTYGANRIALSRHDLQDRVAELNAAGVRLAREAAGERAFVAGSVAPTGLDPNALSPAERDGITEAFREQIAVLRDAGADLVVLETFDLLEEMRLALAAAKAEAGDLPIVAQMRFGPDVHAKDGTEAATAARRMAEWGADVVGANCGGGPHEIFEAARAMVRANVGLPISAQANAGRPQEIEGRLIYVANPDFFATFARRLLKLGVRLVGGCCGTGPEHIHAMSGAVRMLGHDALPAPDHSRAGENGNGLVTLSPTIATAALAERAGPTMAERSRLGAKLGNEFVVSVEVNPPLGLDPTPGVDAARKVITGGATVINTSDGPRASVRMDNMAFGSIVQREIGCEVILHVCCRDRNLLGTMAHLLGAHALGIRNLVVITGDPPKMGDYPDASAVYDLDSIGLLRLIANMNRGIDPAGNEMAEPTRFLLATGAEPAALDYERELERLYRKKEAGADFVMTQPVYDPEIMARFLDDTRDLGLPVLMGLLPLASSRNAEFLHANVPGMRVPDEIRARMRAAGSGPPARAEGVQIAREALTAVRPRLAGAYVLPPLGRYETAIEVFDGFLEKE